jgi:RNA polymerase sigma factor (sigma-70 family)
LSEAPALVEVGRREAAGLAVAEMYERHSRTLYGLCRALLRDVHEAEDALQATFLAAHAALLRGNGPRDEVAWLATIARNECRGRIRTTMRGPTNAGEEPLEGIADPTPIPEEKLSDPEISKALAQLPDSQREAVVLHDVFGLKAREVGKALDISVPAVEALLFRGRRQLRLRLRPAHGALVTPLGVREALAAVIPGFAGSGDAAATAAGGAGIAGAGLLAKLAGAPAAAKVAAGIAAVATAGSVAAVETDRARDDASRPARTEVESAGTAQQVLGAAPTAGATRTGGFGAKQSGSGSSGDGRDDRGDASGAGARSGHEDGSSPTSDDDRGSGRGSSASDDDGDRVRTEASDSRSRIDAGKDDDDHHGSGSSRGKDDDESASEDRSGKSSSTSGADDESAEDVEVTESETAVETTSHVGSDSSPGGPSSGSSGSGSGSGSDGSGDGTDDGSDGDDPTP